MNLPPNNQLSDEQLIDIIVKENRADLFSELYKKYQLVVFKKCLNITKNRDEAQELTQDILCKVFDKLHTFKNQSTFVTWLFAIVYHECINHVRSLKKITHQIIEIQISEEDEEELEEMELEDLKVSRLDEVLNLLHPIDKAILLMKYQEGFKLKQIQTVLNISESSTKMKLKRAKLKALKIYQKKYSK